MKGLSTVIAVILMIAVAVLASLIVMNWFSVLTKSETSIISNSTKKCTAGADIAIQDVYIDFKNNISRVTVRNSGFVDDEIIAGYIIAKDGQRTTNLTAFPVSINKGDLKTIEFNITGKFSSCDNFSKASISSICSSDKFDFAPKCIS